MLLNFIYSGLSPYRDGRKINALNILLISLNGGLMNGLLQTQANVPPILRVAAGEDQYGGYLGLGVCYISFKGCPLGSNRILVLENTFHAKGGPPRHLHYDQDEWFYAVEGEFIIEIGQERMRLNPGDSILAPRQIPHVWAYVGETKGRMLIAFMPAGQMEAFFREVMKANAMPPQDAELLRAYRMELHGPPLSIE